MRARTGPGFMLASKLNSVEFQAGGLTAEEASASQIRMEKGYEPFKLSDAGVAEQFGKDIQTYLGEMAEDADKLTKFGYPDYTGELRKNVAN